MAPTTKTIRPAPAKHLATRNIPAVPPPVCNFLQPVPLLFSFFLFFFFLFFFFSLIFLPVSGRVKSRIPGPVKDRERKEVFALIVWTAPGLHGCGGDTEDDGVSQYPTPDAADASDAEPEEDQGETEKAQGVAFNPDLFVRRLAAAGEGLFLSRGEFR